MSLTGSAYWVSNVIVAQLTPVLLASPLQTFGTFYLLVGVHIAAILFVLLTLPETKVNLVSICYGNENFQSDCITFTGRNIRENRTAVLQTLAGENQPLLLSKVYLVVLA